MIPTDSSLLGKERTIFVRLVVVVGDKCMGSHIAVVTIKVVEDTCTE